MEPQRKRDRVRSFVLGGLVGAGAAVVAARRRRRPPRQSPAGLAAFEDAPCYREIAEKERLEGS
jgi:hypothetical protein